MDSSDLVRAAPGAALLLGVVLAGCGLLVPDGWRGVLGAALVTGGLVVGGSAFVSSPDGVPYAQVAIEAVLGEL